MGKQQPPEIPSDRPSDPIARDQLDDLIELALEQRRAKQAQQDDVIDTATAEAIAAEVGISPEELAQARRTLKWRQTRLLRVVLGAVAVGSVLALGILVATPQVPEERPVSTAANADEAYRLRQEGDKLRKQDRRLHEALDRYRQAVKLTPKDTNAWNDLGIGLKAVGDYAKAETAYRKSISVAGSHPDACYAYYNLANLLDEGPRREESLALYQEAIRRRPIDPDYYNNLGVLLERLGRYDEAIAHYRKALTVNPRYQRAQGNLQALQNALAKGIDRRKAAGTGP